jgi:predicted metal-binding membrane protein
MAQSKVQATMLRARTAVTAAVLAALLGLAGTCWVVAIHQMNGMDMGTGTQLGAFGFFIAVWVAMMVAMMLPGAIPAAMRRANVRGSARAVPLFVGSYLAVWALAGVVLYALYRPHGTAVAGGVVIAVGLYELTPLKRYCRQRCRESFRSGVGFGLYCVGSNVGLILMPVVLGVMSLTWMVVATVLMVGQKLLPARALVDVPLGLAIVGLGIFVLMVPSALPGLTSPVM